MATDEGVIETYDVSDALGSIRLDRGEVVRFGRSACNFDPTVGDRVRVLELVPGAHGMLRAKKVEAVGPREMTESERIVLLAKILLRPVDRYSDWALASRIAWNKREDLADACMALRDELVRYRSWEPGWIDEAIELVRWATEVLNDGEVHRVVGDEGDVWDAVRVAEETGKLTKAQADALADRINRIGR